MTPITVTVASVQGGWSVLSALSAGPLMFLSSADAEEQARRLARLAAGLGWDAEVRLQCRYGEVSVQAYPGHAAVAPIARGAPTPQSPRWGRDPTARLRGFKSRSTVSGASGPY
jgi:hypothetical protein